MCRVNVYMIYDRFHRPVTPYTPKGTRNKYRKYHAIYYILISIYDIRYFVHYDLVLISLNNNKYMNNNIII